MNETFGELSYIVKLQQNKVDEVEANANEACDFTKGGLKQIRIADKKQAGSEIGCTIA